MTETFYGPWRLITQPAGFGVKWSFRIDDSDDADGIHEADSPGPWNLPVHGSQWTLQLLVLDGDGHWVDAPAVTRTTAIVEPQGLTVRLDSHPPVSIECVSLDPTINPPMRPNPYDFTVQSG